MADNTTTVRPEDVTSVGTRISWGAVLAGAVVALAVYVVLTTLGAAIGMSVAREMSAKALTGGALVWAILTAALSLFCGGWTASQLTAGETKCESMMHGVILWGVVAAIMLWMTTIGVRSGFNAMMRVAYAGDQATQDRIDALSERIRAAGDDAASADKEALADVTHGVAMVTWGALFGMLLCMGASILGALVGAGPSRRLLWAGKPPLQRTTVPADRQFASHV
jgi:hypothetical protein